MILLDYQPFVDYQYQLAAKQNQIIQALERIGGFSNPPVDGILTGKIEGFPQFLGYRNKATYPVAISATYRRRPLSTNAIFLPSGDQCILA